MQHHSVEQLTHALTEHLRAEQAVAAALVFGSAVTERMHAKSDLDVALLLRDEYEREALLERLRSGLERVVGRDVDLIVLDDAPTILVHQILKTGAILFCRQPRLYQEFVVRHITEYADFKRIRKPIEDAVLTRRLYGRS
jgi:uncharacterized protein